MVGSSRGNNKGEWVANYGVGHSSQCKFSRAWFEDSLQLKSCKFFMSYSQGIFFHQPYFTREFGFHGLSPLEDGVTWPLDLWDLRSTRLHHILDPLSSHLELYPSFASFRCLVIYVLFLFYWFGFVCFFLFYVYILIFLLYIYICCSFFFYLLSAFQWL